MQTIRRIAMWSGPRNISTAMMRSWENRQDTCVVDEPLYAHYLASTRIEHPGLAEILDSQNTDWREVTRSLIEDTPESGCDIYYQKHMTHHQLPDMELDWILKLDNCFLIRDPDAVIASYSEKRPNVTPEDLGFMQQEQLFRFITENSDNQPPVIDSDVFLQTPRQHLEMLCERLELPFSSTMLTWPSGPRDSDGVWAKYWYHNVEKSTGFMPWSERHYDLNDEQKRISDKCRTSYEALKTKCINPE